MSAAQEFALRGKGTPLPQDPTRHLVTSGPYAYIANPMQFSTCLVLLALAVALGSAQLAGAAAIVVVFSVGLGAAEGLSLHAFRCAARRMAVCGGPGAMAALGPFAATLYYAEGCGPCEAVAFPGRWLVSLRFVPAQQHPTRDLTRLTYAPATEAQGRKV